MGAAALCTLLPGAAGAQGAVDCSNGQNADDPACLGLPEDGQPITNFVPLVAPLLGAAAAAGLAGAGGGDGATDSTTSTSSTTSTTD
ncbi:MAG: hypothetical protein AAGF36_06575 [Pseudomonadota bacterium]